MWARTRTSTQHLMKSTYKFTRKEISLWMLLAVAACFAIGSVGFFLAVLLQRADTSATAQSAQPHVVAQEEKDAAMRSLILSEASSTHPDAETKLQILARLNAR